MFRGTRAPESSSQDMKLDPRLFGLSDLVGPVNSNIEVNSDFESITTSASTPQDVAATTSSLNTQPTVTTNLPSFSTDLSQTPSLSPSSDPPPSSAPPAAESPPTSLQLSPTAAISIPTLTPEPPTNPPQTYLPTVSSPVQNSAFPTDIQRTTSQAFFPISESKEPVLATVSPVPTTGNESIASRGIGRAGIIGIVIGIITLCAVVVAILVFLRRVRKKSEISHVDRYDLPEGSREGAHQPSLAPTDNSAVRSAVNRLPNKLALDSLTPPSRTYSALRESYATNSTVYPTWTAGDTSVSSSPSLYTELQQANSAGFDEGDRFSISSIASRSQPPCYHEDVDTGEVRLAGGPARDSDYMD